MLTLSVFWHVCYESTNGVLLYKGSTLPVKRPRMCTQVYA